MKMVQTLVLFCLCVSMVFECGKNRGMVESEKKKKKKK